MKTNITNLNFAYRYLYPRLTIIVSSGTIKNPNALTIAWSSPLSVDPPLIGVLITKKRFSYNIIAETKEFVINIPNIKQVNESYFIGQVSGRDEPQKIRKAGFSLEPSNKVKAPRIKECQINLECKLVEIIQLSGFDEKGDHDLMVGQVVDILINPDIKDDWAYDLTRFQAIYWRMSKRKEETYQLNLNQEKL